MCTTLLAVDTTAGDSDDNSVGAIVGGVIGGVIIAVIIFIIIMLCYFYFYKNKSNLLA